MPTRPVLHFTHLEHRDTVIANGLLCDTTARETGLIRREAGQPSIKAGRRARQVPIAPFGCVADYVPFYFAPRSPMMSSISWGNVPEFGSDVTGLIYLVTDTDRLVDAGLTVLATDRNARLALAEFRPIAECEDLVDWPLMRVKIWKNTDADPERRERRMAECLVHQHVPFDVITEIGTHGEPQAQAVRDTLARHGKGTPVNVRPRWYI